MRQAHHQRYVSTLGAGDNRPPGPVPALWIHGVPAALGLLGAALVLLRVATCGVGLFTDSVFYVSVARSLLAGEGFIQFTGYPYVLWPPLFPLLLTLFSFHLFDPHDVAGFVNAAAFGLTLFVSGQWLARRIESRFLVV